MEKMSTSFVIFISLFYIVGFFLAGVGISSLNQAMAAKNWVLTSGKVVYVDFVTDRDSEGTKMYKVDIKYMYEANGIPYEGGNLAFGYGASNNQSGQHKIYEKLKSAQKVEVRFNPAKPSQSTLTYGASSEQFVVIAFGVTWLLFTTGLTVIFFFFEKSAADLLNQLVILE